MFDNGDKIWIKILASKDGTSPEALSPGIVLDARVQDREIVRSQSKGGRMLLPLTVICASYRRPTGRAPYYTIRAEQVIGVFPRTDHLPVIDGKKGTAFTDLLPILQRAAQDSLDRLTPAPEASAISEAINEYKAEPALA